MQASLPPVRGLARRLHSRATGDEVGLRRLRQAACAVFVPESRGLQPHGERRCGRSCLYKLYSSLHIG
ncbi:MAG: hypothetical protein MUD01_11145 [Chloroflexaceae bacterium]|nr:hypothetical protein [Chloroflexaceae bacterium]